MSRALSVLSLANPTENPDKALTCEITPTKHTYIATMNQPTRINTKQKMHKHSIRMRFTKN